MPSISVTNLEDMARLLHQSNIPLGNTNEEIAAFYWAVRSGNCFLTQLLAKNDEFRLKFPKEKTDTDSSHLTALQIAAQLGHLEIVDLMLGYLPQVIDPDSNDVALILAINNGHREVVTKLLEHKLMPLDFRYSGPGGLAVLEAAFEKGWSDIIQQTITTYSIIPDRLVVGAQNKTALHLAAEKGHTSIMETLLSSSTDIDPNVMDSTGSTPLLKAVEHGHIGVVELLLANHRVNINQKDYSGNTALLTALGKGQLPLSQLFLDCSDLMANDTNREGVTALMMAASLGCSLSISKLLRHSDIDVHRRAQTTEVLWGSLPVRKEWSALEIASTKGFLYIEHLLSTFSPHLGTRQEPRRGTERPSDVCYSAFTSSSPYTLPGSTSLEAFPSAPTHNLVHSRTEVEEFEYGRRHKKFLTLQNEHKAHGKKRPAREEDKFKRGNLQTRLMVHDEEGRSDSGFAKTTAPEPDRKNKHYTLGFGRDSRGQSAGISNKTSRHSSVSYTPVNDILEEKKKDSDQYELHTPSSASGYNSYPTDSWLFHKLDTGLEKKLPIMPVTKPGGNDTPTSRDRDYHRGNYSFSSLSTTVQSTVSLSANFSNPLSHTQSAMSNYFTAPASETTNNVRPSSLAVENKNHSAIYARTTETLSTTASLHTLHDSGSISTSDGINWGIAAPATAAGLLSLYAVKLQRSGVDGQSQQISAASRMNLTLQKIEGRLISILAVIQAAQSLPGGGSGDPPSDPPPELPTLLPEDLPVVRYLEESIENSPTQSASSQETPSLNLDSRSEYTSEDRTPDKSDPNDSLQLTPLGQTGDQISSGSQVGPGTEHEARDLISILTRDKNTPAVNSAAQCSERCEQQGREDEASLRREKKQGEVQLEVDRELQLKKPAYSMQREKMPPRESLVTQIENRTITLAFKVETFELSEEDIEMFENLHNELPDYDLMSFDFGEP